MKAMTGKCISANSSLNGALPFTWNCDEAGGAGGDQIWSRPNGRNLKNLGRGTCLVRPFAY
jgi:hypothetical protein